MAQVKCFWCTLKGDKLTEMQKESKGYVHIQCLPLYEADKAFKQKEREEQDVLVDTIVSVHKIKAGRQGIPSQFYPFLQECRNDSVLFGKIQKRYKMGVDYLTISNTYEYCADKIEWARGNKQFKNVLSELKYGLAIVKNNIENALKDQSKRDKQAANTVTVVKGIESLAVVSDAIKQAQENRLKQQDTDTDKVDLTSLFD